MNGPAPADRLYLEHIRDCIVNVEEDLKGGYDMLRDNRTVRDAVLRNLQILAESTQRLSDAIKSTRPEIPWKQIAGFRHRLVHDYFKIDLGLIWRVYESHLPALKAAVASMLNEIERSP